MCVCVCEEGGRVKGLRMFCLRSRYIFNHSGAAVEGRTFRDWFINE
jgi:hypothetical protein